MGLPRKSAIFFFPPFPTFFTEALIVDHLAGLPFTGQVSIAFFSFFALSHLRERAFSFLFLPGKKRFFFFLGEVEVDALPT